MARSRTALAMMLAGDDVQSMLLNAEQGLGMGDPFLGALGGIVKRGIGGLLGKLKGRVGRVGLPQLPGRVIKSKTARVIGTGAAGAAVGALGARALMPGEGRRRRGRGITSRELRGFRKVTRLLSTVGMVPRRLGRTRRKVCA